MPVLVLGAFAVAGVTGCSMGPVTVICLLDLSVLAWAVSGAWQREGKLCGVFSAPSGGAHCRVTSKTSYNNPMISGV
ncbi:hypothetical protein LPH50_00575 [Xylella taiwanensis]|uniref:hypothetical protein n=1 Tax=Xylella taiwanensis TaxID=1444770 RepID=UPI0013626113|nr:hypothetical protein [Xylella taiwanensis]MCD8459146.1 hypothetical protein [Xylella taiwanensis]MCD8461961.1 hypothetical protein [Xylella taiwanensis]QKD97487.1 hypothetical protein PLS229_06765 [Xylella taiwanensis]UFM93843.1 hypothetical protein LPH39_00570 [Xylella taiwanensis]UFN02425.1 hypothetical protein LPH43_00650 [Xylella taiwanensis]